jgi:GLPGLI family protein
MKNLKYIYAIIFAMFLFTSIKTKAQNAIFLTHGRIEFERKVNLWAQIDDNDWDNDEDWRTLMRKINPQFKSTFFDLDFNSNKTLFKPGRENPANNKMWGDSPGETNTVFNDLAKDLTTSQKNVFEERFLVQDSLRNIQWKITDEKRTIAGFECRRANALIMDSIYVVAFYTDAITTTGGPESFTGLPGMILGVALPHEHITWFATKVYTENITDADLVPPTKGKKVNNTELLKTLKDQMPTWDKKWANRNIRTVMI